MDEIHRMPPKMAGYTKASGQHDPAGKYLCASCNMYIPSRMAPGKGGCTAVLPDQGESDGSQISAKTGGCNLYMHGPSAKHENTNPNRLSKSDAGYVDNGPFSCKRCGNYLGDGHEGCVRVMAGGKDGVKTIDRGECCNAWQAQEAVPENARKVFLDAESAEKSGKEEDLEYCPNCTKSLISGICLSCAYTKPRKGQMDKTHGGAM